MKLNATKSKNRRENINKYEIKLLLQFCVNIVPCLFILYSFDGFNKIYLIINLIDDLFSLYHGKYVDFHFDLKFYFISFKLNG